MGWQWLAMTLSYFQQSNSSWRLFTVCFVSFSQNKLRLKHEFREVVRESVTITVRNKVQEIILDELWKGNQIDLINNRYTCLTSALDYQQHNIDTSCFFVLFLFLKYRAYHQHVYIGTLSQRLNCHFPLSGCVSIPLTHRAFLLSSHQRVRDRAAGSLWLCWQKKTYRSQTQRRCLYLA